MVVRLTPLRNDTKKYQIGVIRYQTSIGDHLEKLVSNTSTEIATYDTAVTVMARKIELATMQLLIDVAFHLNKDWHEIAEDIVIDENSGRIDYTNCKYVHYNIIEIDGQAKTNEERLEHYKLELYNDFGDRYEISAMKVS